MLPVDCVFYDEWVSVALVMNRLSIVGNNDSSILNKNWRLDFWIASRHLGQENGTCSVRLSIFVVRPHRDGGDDKDLAYLCKQFSL